MPELLTIKESSIFTGKSESIIYKYIRKNRLPVQNCFEHEQNIKKVSKDDLIRIFKLSIDANSEQIQNKFRIGSEQVQNRFRTNEIKEILEEFFTEKETQLTKPLEQQALFLAGKYQTENQFLKEQNETLRMENEQLREKFKALPGPIDEINTKIQQLEQEKEKTTAVLQEEKTTRYNIEKDLSQLQEEKQHSTEITSRLEEEKQKLEEQLKLLPAEPEKINATLLQNAEHLLMLKLQNEEIEKKYLEMESILKSEEEKKQELDSRLKLEEQEKAALVDRLKCEEEKSKAEEQSKKELEEKLLAEQEYKKKQAEEKQYLEVELKKIQEQAEEWKKKALKPWWKFWE